MQRITWLWLSSLTVFASAVHGPAAQAQTASSADLLPESTAPHSDVEESKWPELDLDARVMTGAEWKRRHPAGAQTVADASHAGYFLAQAVMEVEAKISKRLELELGFNLRSVQVRDAFANYAFDDALEVRLGRFKRPFSRLELRSRGRIPFRDRGELNHLLSSANLADRTLGAMVYGRPVRSLRYYLAVMSPAPLGSDIEGADLIGRVLFEPNQSLSFGLAAQRKWSERYANGTPLRLYALGADTKLSAGAFEVTLEAELVQNPNPPPVSDPQASALRTPWAFGTIGYATYAIALSKKWVLEPVVVLEWLDPDLDYSGDDRMRAVAGFSVNFRKNALRLMPQVELQRPTSAASTRGQIANETFYLMVSAQI